MKKLQYLDVAKGLCMILIVFGHIFPHESHPAAAYVYSFHVPAFFIISGLLVEYTKEYQKPLFTLVKSNVLRLIVPYFCFESIYIAVYCLINGLSNIRWLAPQTLTLYSTGIATWFLPVLFVGKLYLILLKKYVRSQTAVGVACLIPFCIALFTGFANLTGHWYLYVFFRACNALGFLWIGTVLCRNIEKLTSNKITLAICLIVSLATGLKNGRISSCWMDYHNPVLYLLAAVSGTLMVLCISRCLEGVKPLMFFSRNSIIVLGTHELILLLLKCGFGEEIVAVYWLPFMALIILMQYPIAFCINRFAPFLLGKWPNH